MDSLLEQNAHTGHGGSLFAGQQNDRRAGSKYVKWQPDVAGNSGEVLIKGKEGSAML
jgi:hypothetical protein